MRKIVFMTAMLLFLSCSGDDDSTCVGAASAATQALTNFSASQTDENCLALKAALENQRDVCGSLSASLTTTLAELECQN